MSALLLFSISLGLYDPVVAETPARAFQLFAEQTRLSELQHNCTKERVEVCVVQRRSSDPVTEIALQLADAEIELALFQQRYTHHNPHLTAQHSRVDGLRRALSQLQQAGLTPERNLVVRELRAQAALASAQLNERMSVYQISHPHIALLKQRVRAINQLASDYTRTHFCAVTTTDRR